MDSFADWLRARADGELRELLSARPELSTPVPADLNALAARAAAPAAVSRALDQLDTFTLATLEALLVLPQPATEESLYASLRGTGTGTSAGAGAAATPDGETGEIRETSEIGDIGEVREIGEITAGDVRGALYRLRSYGLVWGDDGTLRTAPGVRPGINHPAGLGPPVREAFAGYPVDRLAALVADLEGAASRGFTDSSELIERLEAALAEPATLIADAGPAAAAALDQLTWDTPVGRVAEARRPVRVATAGTPVERLLARGLLAATDDRTVALPREVALALRAGRLFRGLSTAPPPLTGSAVPRGTDLVVRGAAGQAFTAVRLVEELLERWGVDPPGVLRSGGLAVRDLRAAAAALDVEEWQAALLIEVAYAAGLLARDDQIDGEWLPSQAYDIWRAHEVAERWTELATAWLETDRVPGLAGARDDRDRPINALSEESVRVSAPAVRRAALESLAAAEDGIAPSADSLRARLAWLRPRQAGRAGAAAGPGGGPGTLRDRMVGWTLREAEVLGLTGFGALAAPGRALLASTDEARAAAIAAREARGSPPGTAIMDPPTATDRPPASTPGAGAATEAATYPAATYALAPNPDTAPNPTTASTTGPAARSPHLDPAEVLARFLPEPVDEVLIQADLTAVAPGPLVTELARELALSADVESTGGATVYRFTPESVRRALDAGRSAADLKDLLDRHSATPVPQPLTYLIDDVARRHGHLRVGSATSYVRTDDPATLDEILADRRASSLRLHRLAPTVLASRLSRGELVEALRSLGFAPVAESPEGGVLITRADARRAAVPPGDGLAPRRRRPDAVDSMIAAAVRALRAGDEAARHGAEVARLRQQVPAGDPPRSPSMATVEELRRAIERGARVWIGYLDQQGQASSRIVEPVRIEGGFVTGYDATRAAVHRFALHRITGVADVDRAAPPD